MKLRAWCSSYSNEGNSLGINRKWCRLPHQDLMNIQRRSVCSNWAMYTLRHWPDPLTTCLFAGSSTKSESKLWLNVKFLCSQNLCFRLMHKSEKKKQSSFFRNIRGDVTVVYTLMQNAFAIIICVLMHDARPTRKCFHHCLSCLRFPFC